MFWILFQESANRRTANLFIVLNCYWLISHVYDDVITALPYAACWRRSSARWRHCPRLCSSESSWDHSAGRTDSSGTRQGSRPRWAEDSRSTGGWASNSRCCHPDSRSCDLDTTPLSQRNPPLPRLTDLPVAQNLSELWRSWKSWREAVRRPQLRRADDEPKLDLCRKFQLEGCRLYPRGNNSFCPSSTQRLAFDSTRSLRWLARSRCRRQDTRSDQDTSPLLPRARRSTARRRVTSSERSQRA